MYPLLAIKYTDDLTTLVHPRVGPFPPSTVSNPTQSRVLGREDLAKEDRAWCWHREMKMGNGNFWLCRFDRAARHGTSLPTPWRKVLRTANLRHGAGKFIFWRVRYGARLAPNSPKIIFLCLGNSKRRESAMRYLLSRVAWHEG